ncbi:MAG: alpha/beta fold hydrolase [Sphingomonadaceae bacterium]
MKLTVVAVSLIGACLYASSPLAAETAPTMVTLSTGSEVAAWTLPPDKEAHKTPIIFVHGGPGMYTTEGAKTKGAPFRAAGFTTIYYDQAGGGKSKKIAAPNYTIERAVADLEALRVALKLDKLVLWGSSYGASLATLYATRNPSHVAGIILTSPGSFPGTHAKHDYKSTNRDKVKIGKELSRMAGKIDRQGAAAEASVSQEEAGRAFDALVNADLLGGMVCKGSALTSPSPGTGGNLFANRMLSKDLDKISFKPVWTMKVPALIVRGSCDFLPESNAGAFATLFGTKLTAIPNTGHGLIENPDALDAVFAAFARGPLASVE